MSFKSLTFVDLFSGIGGFHYGLTQAGHKCIGFCEIDKYAVASYTSMYLITEEQRNYLSSLDFKQRQKEILKEEYRNGLWYSNDIRGLRGNDIPRADIWCFGSCCQSFSLAGKREGLEGESGLIREVFRILWEIEEDRRPEWLIYENVKGMLSSNRGFDFLAILSEMDALGYDIEWQLFNSKWYVPQNRERIYTVGHSRRYSPTKIFPIIPTDEKDNIQHGEKTENITINKRSFIDMSIKESKITNTARCLESRYDNGISNRGGGSLRCYNSPIDINKRSGEIFVGDMTKYFRTISARDHKGFCQQLMSGISLQFKEVYDAL